MSRLISVINVYQDRIKAIARGIQGVIPDIVHHNQNVYVKGKSIFDAVTAIDDILEFKESEKIQGLTVAIDFKKGI